MTKPKTRAVFLDRDGTLMEEVEYCREPEKVRILDGVVEGLKRLKVANFCNVIITNQSGIGRGWITNEDYDAVHARLLELLGDGLVDAAYFCADVPGTQSTRRKPAPGMLMEAARDLEIDLQSSWLIGDKPSDVLSATAAGVHPILVQTGYGSGQECSDADFVAKDFACAVDFILKHSDAR